MVFAVLLVSTFVYKYPQRRANIERKAQAREQIWTKQVGAAPTQAAPRPAWLDALLMAGATAAGLALVAGLAFLALRRAQSPFKPTLAPAAPTSPDPSDPSLQ